MEQEAEDRYSGDVNHRGHSKDDQQDAVTHRHDLVPILA
jgi:hypothetical protein